MMGMDVATGAVLSGDAYRRQTVADILLTPLGSRVMRRDYGSLLLELIDQPWNGATRQRLYAATAVALMRWARWLRLRRVVITPSVEPGVFELALEYERTDLPAPNALVRQSIPLQRQALAA